MRFDNDTRTKLTVIIQNLIDWQNKERECKKEASNNFAQTIKCKQTEKRFHNFNNNKQTKEKIKQNQLK